MITRRAFGAAAAILPWIAPGSVRAQAAAAPAPASGFSPAAAPSSAPGAPYKLADFYGATETYDAALSPDGTRIAVLRTRMEAPPPKPAGGEPVPRKGRKEKAEQLITELLRTVDSGKDDQGRVRMAYIDVLDAAQPDTIKRVLKVGDYRVEKIEWGAEDRLLVWVRIASLNPLAILLGADAGSLIGDSRRILSVGADGTAPIVLLNDPAMLANVYDLGAVIDYLADDPDHVLMQAPDVKARALALWKVNVRTGVGARVELGHWNTYRWVTDRGRAVLRYDTNTNGTVHRVHARAPDSDDWKFVRRTRTDREPDFFYVGPTGKPAVILAAARAEGEDTVSVRELDLRTLAFGPPLHRRDGHDVVGALVDERGRFLGVKYMQERVAYDFVDRGFGGHFRGLNAYLGNERNVSIYDVDAAQNRYLAYVSGPRDPGQQLFYDKAAKRVVSLGSLRPDLDEARLGKAAALSVRTRDGAAVTAYLTAPPGEKPGPLLVWPHGGPELRDFLDYSRTVQIFAAQGWWVLQPNFRGSGGFGQAYADAGRRRWGDRMQEDVEDVVAHVLASGKVDAGRVAIGGASYGGYAALMGAVRRPDLYKAVISVCGPADLLVMLKTVKKEDDDGYEYWSATIGDPAADRARIEAASPAKRAAEIRAPVLLIHGVNDRIVPVEQSRLMAKALKAAGKAHELIEVADFAHANWDDHKDQELMAKKVEFLSKAFA